MTTAHVYSAPAAKPLFLSPKRAWDFLRFLYVQRVAGFRVADTPEFEPQCLPFFVGRLRQAGSYLEFGSGGSTVLAAKFGVPLVAVESDRFFLSAVRKKIAATTAFDASSQTYIYSDIGLTQAWGKPVMQRPSPERVARWRKYPRAPWEALAALPEPHLILIDGRFRVASALMAAKFLRGREGEILFDDYRDRPHYHAVERYLVRRQSVGRMAVFTPRADIVLRALDADIETFSRDWR
jgi:hypothetical protein